MNETVTETVFEAAAMRIVIPAQIAKRAHEKSKERADDVKRWANESICGYSEWIKRESEKIKTADAGALKDSQQWARAMAALTKFGFKPQVCGYPFWQIDVNTTEKRLKRLYDVIGRLDGDKIEKGIVKDDAGVVDKDRVRIYMPSVLFPFVKVTWTRKLTDKDKCRVVEERIPARTEYNIVCEVNK